MMQNIPNYILACLVVAQTGVASVDVAKMYAFHQNPNPIFGTAVAPATVSPGEEVLIDWALTKTVDCPGKNNRVWNGSEGYVLIEETKPTTLPMSPEEQHYSISTIIPHSVPKGPLSLSVIGTYNCGDILGDREFTLGPVEMVVK